MGSASVFYEALIRKPLAEYRYLDASGVQKFEGIEPANVHWKIYVACSNGDSINAEMYEALHTTIDLAGLEDILEMMEVHGTWRDAMKRMAQQEADIERTRRGG